MLCCNLLLQCYSFYPIFRAALKNIDVQRDKVKYRTAVQKVIGYMTLGLDVSSLFSEMMMVCKLILWHCYTFLSFDTAEFEDGTK